MSCVSGSISNGYTVSSVNLFNVNETVTYTCNTFYTLSGNAVATCLDVNGTWSARPSCKLVFYDNDVVLREILKVAFDNMSCTSKSISNGYIVSSSNLYNVNDTVTYACNSFYTLSGNAVATCLDISGTWSTIPECKLALYDNVWFWMTVGLASLVALVLLLILLIVLIRWCCCHRRRSRVSEFTESEDRYGDSCGPCCGLVDRKGCCSLYGCCGFFGCMGGFCGCCRCCREFPNEHSTNRGRNSNEMTRPPKKKMAVRQTQTSPTPTDTTDTMDDKKKIAKMNGVYIISNHVESAQTAPLSTKPQKKVHTSATQTFTPRDESMTSEEKNQKKAAKTLNMWMPHSHGVRPINTSTK